MKCKTWIIYFVAACGLCSTAWGCHSAPAGVVWENSREENSGSGETAAETAGFETPEQTITEYAAIMVDICGAVKNPGVYELKAGARVCDAVEEAGGLLPDADVNALNQAALLQDADKILVYTVQETAQGMSASGGLQESGKININTADIAQLTTLPGIGESRAKDIIAYREAHGGFQTPEEIMKVSGIKEATFSKMKDEIIVR